MNQLSKYGPCSSSQHTHPLPAQEDGHLLFLQFIFGYQPPTRCIIPPSGQSITDSDSLQSVCTQHAQTHPGSGRHAPDPLSHCSRTSCADLLNSNIVPQHVIRSCLIQKCFKPFQMVAKSATNCTNKDQESSFHRAWL